MKLIATAQTFSCNDQWVEIEVYRHGSRYRVKEQDTGLGSGIFCDDDDEPAKYWATPKQVWDILTMDTRDAGVVDIIDERECGKILDKIVTVNHTVKTLNP